MKLEWIDDPGVKAQSNLGGVTYYVVFPSVQVNISDPSLSFSEPKQYMATAVKLRQGMPTNYLVGHGYNNVQQATTACQEDYDRYGEAIPPGKEPPAPPLPPSPPEMT